MAYMWRFDGLRESDLSKPIQQRRQNIVGQMPFELFDCPEVLLAYRTAGLNDLAFVAHERGKIVPLNLVLDCR
jgi:hypothetical protein